MAQRRKKALASRGCNIEFLKRPFQVGRPLYDSSIKALVGQPKFPHAPIGDLFGVAPGSAFTLKTAFKPIDDPSWGILRLGLGVLVERRRHRR